MDYDPTKTNIDTMAALDEAAIRNGFGTLPLVVHPGEEEKNGLLSSKACLIKGWPNYDHNAEDAATIIRRWKATSTTWQGLTIPSRTRGLLRPTALDFDINDPVIEQVLEAVGRKIGQQKLLDMAKRTGAGYKLCLLAGRRDEPMGRKVTSKTWLRPGEKCNGHRLEIFDGWGQIGIAGVHSYRVIRPEPVGSFFTPSPQSAEPAIVYDWRPGPTPFNTHRDRLPKLTRFDLLAIFDALDEQMAKCGWVNASGARHSGNSTSVQGKKQFVPMSAIEFDTEDGAMTYDELVVCFRMGLYDQTGLNVAMMPLAGHGTKTSGRGWAYKITRHGRVWVAIYDHEYCLSYLPEELRPMTRDEQRRRFNALQALAGKRKGIRA